MSVRVAATLAAVALTASCVLSDDRPLPACPMPAVATTAAPAMSVSGPVKSWRAVLVAGDDSSPAFDNGIGTLRDRLAAAGVPDIKTLSASTADGSRSASVANFSAALQASTGGSACLVYLTSHGAPEGFFLRPGVCLMGSAALDQALTEGCGGAPTVVVVSACHSGAFLTDAMRQPNRIILTASAADRTSFGCGADNDYTYYDACFLQQFDTARTWQQMGYATRACVENLERQLKVPTASQPQIFIGAAVGDLRLPGR